MDERLRRLYDDQDSYSWADFDADHYKDLIEKMRQKNADAARQVFPRPLLGQHGVDLDLDLDEATKDEATKDEATKDEATKDDAQCMTDGTTEAAKDMATKDMAGKNIEATKAEKALDAAVQSCHEFLGNEADEEAAWRCLVATGPFAAWAAGNPSGSSSSTAEVAAPKRKRSPTP